MTGMTWSEPDRAHLGYAGMMPGRSADSYRESELLQQAGEQLGTMQSISGYAQAYMPLNHLVYLTGFADSVVLPFSAPLGASKNAHVDGDGITFDAAGLWVARAFVRFDNPTIDTGINLDVTLAVCALDGTVLDAKVSWCRTDGHGTSAFFEHTFVLTDADITDGRVVRVRVGHNSLAAPTALGGTAATGLTVNRWDLSTAGAVVATNVPDGTPLGTPPNSGK